MKVDNKNALSPVAFGQAGGRQPGPLPGENPFGELPGIPGLWAYADKTHATQAEQFDHDMELIKVVPELVGIIAMKSADVARVFSTTNKVDEKGKTVVDDEGEPVPEFPTNTVYTTHEEFDEANHHSGHPRPGSRIGYPLTTVVHPLLGKARPAAFSQAETHQTIHDELAKGGRKYTKRGWKNDKDREPAPQGWKFGIGSSGSKVSDFAMLSSDGQIYEVSSIASTRSPQRNNYNPGESDLGLGHSEEGSETNFLKYMPAFKVAAALVGKVPTNENIHEVLEAGEAAFATTVGPDWTKVGDPMELINSLPKAQRAGALDSLKKLGSMDNVEHEVKHLIAIVTGLGRLAAGSGKFPMPVERPKTPDQIEAEEDARNELRRQAVSGILPELDAAEAAIAAAKGMKDARGDKLYTENMAKLKDLEFKLAALGASRIPAVADRSKLHEYRGPVSPVVADSRFHEIVAEDGTPLPDSVPGVYERITKEYRRGYTLVDTGEVVRRAQVVVDRAPDPGTGASPESTPASPAPESPENSGAIPMPPAPESAPTDAAAEARKVAVVRNLLPDIDDLGLAIKKTPQTPDNAEELQSKKDRLDSLMNTLYALGVEHIPTAGNFNPAIHEPIDFADNGLPNTDDNEDMVIEELRSGYTLNGRVIRPAWVKAERRKKTS